MRWNDEQNNKLRELYANNLSITEIGNELSRSRGSISGQINRLGLSRAWHPSSKPQRFAEPNGSRVVRSLAKPERKALPNVAIQPNGQARRKTFFNLGPHDCRWPLGVWNEQTKWFCAAKAVTGRPYCEAHCRIAGHKYAKQ